MKKIAFIFSQFPSYDETFILREMNELRDNGLNFTIFSIKRCKDKIIHDDAKELVKLSLYSPFISLKLILANLYFAFRHPLRYSSAFIKVLLNNIKSLGFFFKSICLWPQAVGFAWQARKDKITHVHGQWATYPATYAFIISRLNNIPFSFTGHAHDIYVNTVGLREKIREARFITTCTQDNKRYLLRLLDSGTVPCGDSPFADKIIVSYHGVDIDKFKAQSVERKTASQNSKLKIISVGSLFECKGFDILIEACRILRDRGVDFECTIAGGGPLETNLRSQAASHMLQGKIKFTGYITQNELIPLYQQADVFALPIRLAIHWGIPNVVIEAMAAGIPVITGTLPSIPEIIRDGVSGFIIPEEDPQALADKLMLLAQNPELRQQISEAGYANVEDKFDIKKNALKMKELFQRALCQTAHKNNAAVLVYHRISDEHPDKYIAISTSNFRKQIEFLSRQHVNAKTITITFDDGWKDNYTNAYPILKQYGFKATIFLTVDKIGKDSEFLSWDEVKEMSQNGITFGSHTLTHPNLCLLSVEDAKREILDSKYILEEKLGQPIELFCYPKGNFNEMIKSLVKEAGYKAAFSVIPGKNRVGDDPYEIKRIGVGNKDSLSIFKFKLSPAYELLRNLIPPYTTQYASPLPIWQVGSTHKRINVLYLIWSLGLGGAERVVINLAKGLDKTKFNLVICCLNDKGVFAGELEREGIKVVALDKRRGIDISIIGKIINVIKENQIDIVHTHLWGANFWGRIAARIAKVPVIVCTEHNVDSWKSGVHLFVDRFLSRFTHKIIAVSNKVKEFYVEKGISENKIEVIYNGINIDGSMVNGQWPMDHRLLTIDVKHEFGINNNETVLAVIGRLVEQKGHKYLFEALNMLDGKYSYKLLVVGDGPLRKELELLVNANGRQSNANGREYSRKLALDSRKFALRNKIIFTGFRKDVADILRAVDVLVMPSLREGLPIVALEAMASGVPVVATKVGGLPEVIKDAVTGILVSPEDSVALANGLKRVLDDKELARRMGENGQKLVRERFSMEKMIGEHERLYEELLEKKESRNV